MIVIGTFPVTPLTLPPIGDPQGPPRAAPIFFLPPVLPPTGRRPWRQTAAGTAS